MRNVNKPLFNQPFDSTRLRVIKWFQRRQGYSIDIYTRCDYKYDFCCASEHTQQKLHFKELFQRFIDLDMDDLEQFNTPSEPVYLSESTDPFQSLERSHSHTRYALEQIIKHRTRFTVVFITTKNPLLPIQLGYLDILRCLRDYHPFKGIRSYCPGLFVEVSLSFWRDSTRIAYEEHAPSVEDRIEGIRILREEGIQVVLRIDTLFPRSPITENPIYNMSDFGLPEAQTIEDLNNLATFAKEVRARAVVYSTAKIVPPRLRKFSKTTTKLWSAYRTYAAPEKLIWQDSSWQLPPCVAEQKIINPFLEIFKSHGIVPIDYEQYLTRIP